MFRSPSIAGVTIVVMLLALPLGAQNVLSVPGTHTTIQAALDASAPGDVVQIGVGTFVENLVFPGHDLVLRGSVPGPTRVDGGGLGPCLLFSHPVTAATTIESIIFTNGTGYAPAGQIGTWGGAVYIQDPTSTSAVFDMVFRDCEFSSSTAVNGGGGLCLRMSRGSPLFEDCLFRNNVASSGSGGAAVYVSSGPGPKFRRCRFENNTGGDVGGLGAFYQYEVTDCSFTNNTALLTSGSAAFRLGGTGLCERNRIVGNQSLGPIGGIAVLAGEPTTTVEIRESLFADNSARGAVFEVWTYSCRIVNCSFAGNDLSLSTRGLIDVETQANQSTEIWNSCLWGNQSPAALYLAASAGPVSFDSCDVEGGPASAANGNFDADPLYVDPLQGDYSLLPGSPCLDAGSPLVPGGLSAVDLAGKPRVRYLTVDVGCFENGSIALSAAAASRVGVGAGGPYDVLLVNGSNGGPLRKVIVPVGSPGSVAMLQPPHLATAARFAVYGFLGEADPDSVVGVPLGIGAMAFAPSPMVPPYFRSIFFTFTDNYAPTTPQLFPSSPTPWSSGLGPAIPFPLVITLQGVVEEAPGLFRATNAVVYELR